MAARITLKTIAAETGVHFSTVSLALNNHPSIPLVTRERIRAVAERLGYRPDPVLASLVAYRVRQSRSVGRGVLAWLDTWAEARSLRRLFPALWEGAAARADELGWKLEEFRMGWQGLSPEKFSRMLRTRGIEGVVVAPMPGEGASLMLDWRWVSAVVVSHTLISPRLHRVMPHQVHNMQILMRELRRLGYCRPGFALDQTLNERTRHYWMATFLDAQLALPKTQRLEPFTCGFEQPRKLLAWFEKRRPDVIVSTRPAETRMLLEESGYRVPTAVGIASPAFPTETWEPKKQGLDAEAEFSGIDERFDRIGAAAVDTLVGLIHRHERGVPVDATHILIEGRWRSGASTRPQA